MILGTISAVDNDNGLQLIIDGEDAPTTKKYTYMASYCPTANDRVIVEEVGGSYVIMGKIISDYTSSGVARLADTATNAINATNADNATTADACTGNAATATTAASCSGNAATATVSNTTKGFDGSVGSAYGELVTRVDRSYNSTLGSWIVTDVQTTISHNFTYK